VFARLRSDRGETVSDRFVHVDSRAVGGPVTPKRWRAGGWWTPVMTGVAALVVAASVTISKRKQVATAADIDGDTAPAKAAIKR